MEVRQIELFIAAAEERHFTRAAQRANIVQSGLSTAIRNLEDELGATLFVRSTRRVELSEAGRAFLPEARQILASVSNARQAIAAIQGGLRGRLALGTVQSLGPFLDLPKLLQDFRTRYPDVEILVREGHLEGLAQALRQGDIDLSFMPTAGVGRSGLSVELLFSSPLAVAVPPDHRLAGERTVSLEAIAHEAFVDFSPRWGTRALVDQVFAIEGVHRSTAFELENFELLYQFVARGFGVAVVPAATLAGRNLPHLQILPARTAHPLPEWELGMFEAKAAGDLPSNPPAALFKAMIREELIRLHLARGVASRI
ncbi:MAG: Transcriptional regulator, LysR family [Hyphomicrobiales bacterium]|nr:Transcriptional regulator, LysR family [Hyphomicrobiales bacterium]